MTLAGDLLGDPVVKHLSVSVGDVSDLTFQFDTTGHGRGEETWGDLPMGWELKTFTFTATSTTTTLQFNGLDVGSECGAEIDNVVVTAVTPTVTTVALHKGYVGVEYSQFLSVSGGTAPYTWSGNSLPLGLEIDPSTGELHGAPTTAGVYTFTVQVVGSVARTLSLTVSDAIGSPYAWGNNYNGQLGNHSNNNSLTPVEVSDLTDIINISGRYAHHVALKSDGAVWAWGSNNCGQVGISPYISAGFNTPQQMASFSGSAIVDVSTGSQHSYAVDADGAVWAWGFNYNAQMGNGLHAGLQPSEYYPDPAKVHGPGDSGTLSGMVAVSAGEYYGLALKEDGTVWAWGNPNGGGLGDAGNSERFTPIQVQHITDPTGYLSDIVAIAAGSSHNLALKADGTVWSWGANNSGSLGDGTSAVQLTPIQVVNDIGGGFLTGVIAIDAGYDYSLALDSDGNVWAWGQNNSGQLGIDPNSQADSYRPAKVNGISDVTAIAAGGGHVLARKSDGTVWAWGRNTDGQLGNGGTANSWTPSRVSNFGDAGFIVAGSSHSLITATYSADLDPITITPSSASSGVIGQSYSLDLNASGGSGEGYTWSVSSGALPTWAHLNSSTGVISGTPASSGDVGAVTFTIHVVDNIGTEATKQYTITASYVLITTDSTLPSGDVKSAYTTTLAALGGTSPYKWSIQKGTSMPSGLKITASRTNPAQAIISGKPSRPGTFTFTVIATDKTAKPNTHTGSKSFTITVYPALVIATRNLPNGDVDTPYSASLSVSGGTSSYVWSKSGNWPAGLSLNASTGAITGTPAIAGTYRFSVTATDDLGYSISKSLSIKVNAALSVATTALSNTVAGSTYKQALKASGGSGKYTWSITSGALPSNLSMTTKGAISGKTALNSADVYSLTIRVSDGIGTATRALSITVE